MSMNKVFFLVILISSGVANASDSFEAKDAKVIQVLDQDEEFQANVYDYNSAIEQVNKFVDQFPSSSSVQEKSGTKVGNLIRGVGRVFNWIYGKLARPGANVSGFLRGRYGFEYDELPLRISADASSSSLDERIIGLFSEITQNVSGSGEIFKLQVIKKFLEVIQKKAKNKTLTLDEFSVFQRASVLIDENLLENGADIDTGTLVGLFTAMSPGLYVGGTVAASSAASLLIPVGYLVTHAICLNPKKAVQVQYCNEQEKFIERELMEASMRGFTAGRIIAIKLRIAELQAR